MDAEKITTWFDQAQPILVFNEFGPTLAVRPYCHTSHYWQVYFDTSKTIADTLGAAGFPVATRPVKVYPV